MFVIVGYKPTNEKSYLSKFDKVFLAIDTNSGGYPYWSHNIDTSSTMTKQKTMEWLKDTYFKNVMTGQVETYEICEINLVPVVI